MNPHNNEDDLVIQSKENHSNGDNPYDNNLITNTKISVNEDDSE